MAGLETVSTKRARVYVRSFDHEEAQRLREDEGWTYNRIADRFGVSPAAVIRVCDPKVRARMDAQANKWAHDNRSLCKGGCGTLVWTHVKGRSGYCVQCFNERRMAPDVRPTELRCTKCDTWKPDAEFPRQKGRKVRRGLDSWCRSCSSAARAANRKANPDRDREADRKYKRRKMRMGEYVVLRRDSGSKWLEVSHVEAASRMHAIEQAADTEGDYVAVTQAQITPFEVRQTMAFRVVSNGKGDPTKNA